ncbi:MAG TPA: hypothetical protein VFU90_01860 [Candidatus Tumulicola sp.]|nr:hypothetical protein [Candidatus Tumulicola sp.]
MVRIGGHLRRGRAIALPVALLTLTAATVASPASDAGASAPTAAEVLSRAQSRMNGLKTYQVPLTMSGSVKISFVSVPFHMSGTEYYSAPNRHALHMDSVPSLARGFENTMASMGGPKTWLATYDIAVRGIAPHGSHNAYVLFGTPRKPANVKNVTLWISAKTYAVESVAFNYNNGATLNVDLGHRGYSPYQLPTHATVSAKFPQYAGQAQVQYGTYQINAPVPDSVFQKQ